MSWQKKIGEKEFMKKARLGTTLVGAFIILVSALTAPLMAGSIGIGLKGEVLYATATGEEFLKTTTANAAENNGKYHNNYGAAASGFVQYTFQDDGFVIGISRIPYETSLGKIDKTRHDNLATYTEALRITTPQHVEAALKNHTTYYFETPGFGAGSSGGLYLTGGWTSADLLTQEDLGTGSSYPDAEVDGYTIGLGWKSGTDSGILAKIAAEYTDYEDIQLKSTGSDTSSTIDATLDTYSITMSVGYSF